MVVSEFLQDLVGFADRAFFLSQVVALFKRYTP